MTTYHLARGQQQLGQMTELEVREGLANGNVQPTDLAWCQGMPEWKPVSTIFLPPQTLAPTIPNMPMMIAGAQPANSGQAVASLVLGIVSWVGCFCCINVITAPLAIIFGHLGMSEVKRSQGMKTGHGMALAGLIMGYLMIAYLILSILVQGLSFASIFSSEEFKKAFREGMEKVEKANKDTTTEPAADEEVR